MSSVIKVVKRKDTEESVARRTPDNQSVKKFSTHEIVRTIKSLIAENRERALFRSESANRKESSYVF